MLSDVFDMFTRERPDNGGLGVGLALVSRIVTLHGGSVEGKSEGRDRGSEFIVHLPVHERAGQVDRPTTTPRADVSGVRVAVVEDNDDIRDLMCASLERRGFAVRSASDGQTGLDSDPGDATRRGHRRHGFAPAGRL